MLLFSYLLVFTYVWVLKKTSLFEYPQNMFWLRNKKVFFFITHSYFEACVSRASLKSIVWYDTLHPSQQFYSHVGTCLPGLHEFLAVDKVSSSRAQHTDSAGSEARPSNPLIPCLKLYQLSHCAPHHSKEFGVNTKTPQNKFR